MPPMNAAPVVPLFDSHCGGSLAVQLDSPMEGVPSENEYAKSAAPSDWKITAFPVGDQSIRLASGVNSAPLLSRSSTRLAVTVSHRLPEFPS